MFNYLIRVQLPDRPGALGAVASRIGSVGGDVVSIDILQREDGVVIDELGVGLAVDDLIELLRDEILEVDGVSIESVRSVAGEMPDRTTEFFDIAAELFTQTSPTELLEHLTARVRRTLMADFAVVIAADHVSVLAGDGALPLGVGSEVAAELRPDMTAAGLSRSGGELRVGRQYPVLRQRERQWVTTMADLADHRWQELQSPDV